MELTKQFYKDLDSKILLEATLPLEYESNELLLRNLSCILTLAGISSFDISANPESVKYVKEGIKDAFIINKNLNEGINNHPFIKISLGALNPLKEQYYHLGSDDKFFSKSFIEKNLSACIEKGSQIIELHTGNMDDEQFLSIWKIINELSQDGLISINLNRVFKSNAHLVNLIKKAYEINRNKPILQIDGATSKGKVESYSDSLQSLATADILIKELKIKEKKRFRKMYIVLCGDINTKTNALALICNIEYSGLSLGHHYMNSHFSFLNGELNQKKLLEDMDRVHLLLPKVKDYLKKFRMLKK